MSRGHRIAMCHYFDSMGQQVNSALQVRRPFKECLANWLGDANQLNVIFPEPRKERPQHSTKKTKLMHDSNDGTDL